MKVMQTLSQVCTWPKVRRRKFHTWPSVAILSANWPHMQQKWLLFASVIKPLNKFYRALNQPQKCHKATLPGKVGGMVRYRTPRTLKRARKALHKKCYEVINLVLTMKSSHIMQN